MCGESGARLLSPTLFTTHEKVAPHSHAALISLHTCVGQVPSAHHILHTVCTTSPHRPHRRGAPCASPHHCLLLHAPLHHPSRHGCNTPAPCAPSHLPSSFPIHDFDPYDLRRKLPKAVARLAREHNPESGGTVYIHCTAGGWAGARCGAPQQLCARCAMACLGHRPHPSSEQHTPMGGATATAGCCHCMIHMSC